MEQAISADGSVVVGWAYNTCGQWCAFRWTTFRGMEGLNQTCACLLTHGSVLIVANAVSPDGHYIVGYGYNAVSRRTEAFLLAAQYDWQIAGNRSRTVYH